MSAAFVRPAFQRTLAVAYRFYDAFAFPVNDSTQPILAPLEVTIPELHWTAFRAEVDGSYRFSARTLNSAAPTGTNLAVEVRSPGGLYVNLDPILLTLPLGVSSPPQFSNFVRVRRLWPTTALRPPANETAIRGRLTSPTSQPVSGLRVEMWTGSSVTPPAGTPFTQSNENGEFLFRFPAMKALTGATVTLRIRLNNGAVAVTPASQPMVVGGTRILPFQRT